MKKKSMTVPYLECLRCGISWYPRSEKLPRYCPVCKNPNWNKPKKVSKV